MYASNYYRNLVRNSSKSYNYYDLERKYHPPGSVLSVIKTSTLTRCYFYRKTIGEFVMIEICVMY